MPCAESLPELRETLLTRRLAQFRRAGCRNAFIEPDVMDAVPVKHAPLYAVIRDFVVFIDGVAHAKLTHVHPDVVGQFFEPQDLDTYVAAYNAGIRYL